MLNLESYGARQHLHSSATQCILETYIPEGLTLEQHEHTYDHFSVVVDGLVAVSVDGGTSIHAKGAIINVARGKKHSVLALEDSIWLCIHNVGEETVDALEIRVVKK